MQALVQSVIDYLSLSPLAGEVLSLIFILVAAVIVFSIGMTIGGLMTFAERRVAARVQSRIGPNRVGPLGLLQWLADGLKLIMKEDLIPDNADPLLFRLAPYLVVAGVFGAFVTLPFGQSIIAADLNIGIFFLLAITSLVTVGILMSGWASNNKWSLLGGIRSAAQIISYEVPSAMAVLTVVLLSGTLSMQGIIGSQGGWPWQWYIFHNPFTFVAFFLYFTAALAEGNRTPFDLPEAESELVAGYNTEYSGMRFAAFFLGEFTNVYLMCAIATSLFFGGWQLPGVTAEAQGASWVLQGLGLLIFLAKACVGIWVVIMLRWTLPRLRIDQLMILCYRYLIPISFACLLGNALYMLIIPMGSWADAIVHWVTAACGAAMFVAFVRKVFGHIRKVGDPIDLDFLARGEKSKFNPETQVRGYGAFRKIAARRAAK